MVITKDMNIGQVVAANRELIPILAAIWPAIDPCHTTLNNAGDLAGTVVVSRSLDKMDMDVFNK